jgi:16S rRNA G1207 methylase RsmC
LLTFRRAHRSRRNLRDRTTSTRVAGLDLTILPSVFHPKVFVTSDFFAHFLRSLDLTGKAVVGTGSGVLALSAAKAGAASALALDINPAAVEAAQLNAERNRLDRVRAQESNLFSAVSAIRSSTSSLFTSQRIAIRSIWVEAFYLYELRLRGATVASAS